MKVFLTASVLLMAAQWTAAQDIGGHYAVKGTGFEGTIYEGDAQITPTSEYTCKIVWHIGSDSSDGICMRDGNAFTAGYQLNGKVGLVIYLVQDDGSLEGTWTVAGVNAVGTEILTPE